ncbi:PAS domain-containing sensor histidine kinase [Aestuariispira insulae]|uniref:histidine kinase n=1 Tax=Aestuariispira insulae TaxID=1461337 RepID=A0A3D9HY55_9PROT|nr:HAMP domain-containing sensor histidine kinase [Aestuariispira insulae]RED54350.1 PAS domain S-box-containing protein [Aestuariispira insulae]
MTDNTVELYQSMFENAVEGMYRTVLNGDYVIVNPALARIHGCENVDEFMSFFGAKRTVYVNPEDRRYLIEQIRTHNVLKTFECLAWRKDGSTFWMLESGRGYYDKDGTLLGVEGVVEDITKLKETEQELRQARQQAVTADRVKTELLNNVGHELRTPLNSIIGFSEIIQKYSEENDLEDELSTYSREIKGSANQLLQIINDLLEFSQINAGLHRQKFDEVDVVSLIYSIDRRFRPEMERHGLNLVIDICRETPALRADERAMKRILEILMSNAVKFTPYDGEVEISVHFGAQGELIIRITDTGIGFRQEDVVRALTPFMQVDSSLTRKYEGMGLGLPIAHNLVERMGGVFSILTAPEQGTEATITFPAELVRIITAAD